MEYAISLSAVLNEKFTNFIGLKGLKIFCRDDMESIFFREIQKFVD
jgi:hypothetical protein